MAYNKNDYYFEVYVPTEEDILRNALTIPRQWDVELGNPNEVYFDDKLISNLENEIAPFVGVNVAGGPVSAIISSMVLDFSNNLSPKEGPPSKLRQKLVEQLIHEWNKIPGNRQIEIRAFDYNMRVISDQEATWSNIGNNINDTIAGGFLSGVDLVTLKGLPAFKSLLQPRLPRYKRRDISLNLAIAYQYKEEGYGIVQEYYRSVFHKVPGFEVYPHEDTADGYIASLELQIRDNKIIEGRMQKEFFNNRDYLYILNGKRLNGAIYQDFSTYNY